MSTAKAAQALTMQRILGLTFDQIIFTNFGNEHGEFYTTQEEYFIAKKNLLNYLKPQGVALLNGDDEKVSSLINDIEFKDKNIIMYGQNKTNLVQFCATQLLFYGSSFEVDFGNGERYFFKTVLHGIHMIYNITVALLAVKKKGSFFKWPAIVHNNIVHVIRPYNLNEDRRYYFFNFVLWNVSTNELFRAFLGHDLVLEGCRHSLDEMVRFCYRDSLVLQNQMLQYLEEKRIACSKISNEQEDFYQRVIDPIAGSANYMMLDTGQPLHIIEDLRQRVILEILSNPEEFLEVLVKVAKKDDCFRQKFAYTRL